LIAAECQLVQTQVDEAIANDGAHPRAAGYAEFAEVVENWDAWLNWFK
jgi:lysophospholipase L1-like esterase